MFEAKAHGLVEGKPVASVIEPLLVVCRTIRDQVAVLDRKLIEAAQGDAACLLVRVQRPSALEAWGLKLAQRLGFERAAVALARKLGVVPRATGKAGTPFQAWPPGATPATA